MSGKSNIVVHTDGRRAIFTRRLLEAQRMQAAAYAEMVSWQDALKRLDNEEGKPLWCWNKDLQKYVPYEGPWP